MFDEFVTDSEGYDLLKNPGERTWLLQWSELVDALNSEGALTVVDVAGAVSLRRHQRAWMLRLDLQNPQRWWQAMGYFDSLTGRARKLLAESPREAENLAWKFDPKARFGVPGSDGETHDLSVVLVEAGHSRTKSHRELYTNALENFRTHLREVNACISACKELGVAPMMWAPYRRYLKEKLTPEAQEVIENEDAGRRFFEIAFPAYAPITVREFSKLRSDHRIGSLRSEISRASRDGASLEPRYPQKVLSEVLRLERRVARMRQIIGWIATAAGVIPVPGLGVAATALAEGASALVDRRLRKPWRWFFLISDGRGAT